MLILVPWKPVALVLGLLSALILVSYFGSSVLERKDPFAISSGQSQRSIPRHTAGHSVTAHKSLPHASAPTTP